MAGWSLYNMTPIRFSTSALMERLPSRWPKPVWHAPWKNYRVISGHLGWVRSIAFDPGNEWFCTGSADRTIKIWDLASGTLKLTLTGHIEQVRGKFLLFLGRRVFPGALITVSICVFCPSLKISN
jgi:WD40 repeat protein